MGEKNKRLYKNSKSFASIETKAVAGFDIVFQGKYKKIFYSISFDTVKGLDTIFSPTSLSIAFLD
jgi:hypothetical protein